MLSVAYDPMLFLFGYAISIMRFYWLDENVNKQYAQLFERPRDPASTQRSLAVFLFSRFPVPMFPAKFDTLASAVCQSAVVWFICKRLAES